MIFGILYEVISMDDILGMLVFTVCLFFLIAIPVAVFNDSGAYASVANARASIQMQRQIELTERARIRSETINNFTELASIVIVSLIVLVGGGFGVWKFLDKQSERNYNREIRLIEMLTNNKLLPENSTPSVTNNVTNNYFNINPTPVDYDVFQRLLESRKFQITTTEEGYYKVLNPATQEVKLLDVKE